MCIAQTSVSLTMMHCLVQRNHTWSWRWMEGMLFLNKESSAVYFTVINTHDLCSLHSCYCSCTLVLLLLKPVIQCSLQGVNALFFNQSVVFSGIFTANLMWLKGRAIQWSVHFHLVYTFIFIIKTLSNHYICLQIK